MILLLLLLLCILGSFFFSGSETGFISWNPLKVGHSAAQGNLNARVALYFMNHKDRLLSTILIGNNICNVAAALIFSQLYLKADQLFPLDLGSIPSPESWFLTPVMVLFGEMIPKTLYRIYPFRLTLRSIPILAILYIMMFPFSWLLSQFSKLIGASEARSGESYRTKVREEMLLVAVEGAKRGTLFETADQVMNNTFRLRDREVLSISSSLDQWKKNHALYTRSQNFSQIGKMISLENDDLVVFSDDLKKPVGYIRLLDLIPLSGKTTVAFGKYVKPLPALRSTMTLLSCLRRIREDSPRYFVILDKDGAIEGILDKMDLFEAAFSKLPSTIGV